MTLGSQGVSNGFLIHIQSNKSYSTLEPVFFLAESSTVVIWGSLSDRFGHRPILLLGPLGLTFSMLSFGTSTTYTPLVISRFCQGLFNGCVGGYIAEFFFFLGTKYFIVRTGVSQSMIAEVRFLSPTKFSSV